MLTDLPAKPSLNGSLVCLLKLDILALVSQVWFLGPMGTCLNSVWVVFICLANTCLTCSVHLTAIFNSEML